MPNTLPQGAFPAESILKYKKSVGSRLIHFLKSVTGSRGRGVADEQAVAEQHGVYPVGEAVVITL